MALEIKWKFTNISSGTKTREQQIYFNVLQNYIHIFKLLRALTCDSVRNIRLADLVSLLILFGAICKLILKRFCTKAVK